MKMRFTESFSQVIGVLFLLIMIGMSQPAMAMVGPVNSPPGGVTVSDNDPGDGEQWGRVGGRIIIFSNFQLIQFSQLLWGPSHPEAVNISFDGNIDTQEEKNLVWTIDSLQGQVVWNGKTYVELFTGNVSDGMYPVYTKFILTVTDSNGNPVIFTPNPLTGLPQVNVISLPPNSSEEVFFTATLEVLAKNPSASHTECSIGVTPTPEGEYGPAIDVYDCLKTNPIAQEPVLTVFDWGFFYELSEDILSLEEHDLHITNLINNIEGKTDEMSSKVQFLFEDWVPCKEQVFDNQMAICTNILNLENTLVQPLNDLKGQVDIIPGKIDDLSAQISQINIEELSNQIGSLPNTDLLLLLFGLPDFVQDPNLPPFEMVSENSYLYKSLNVLEMKVDALRTAVDEQRPPAEIKLQIVDSLRSMDGVRRFVVLLKVNGKAVNADIVSVEALVDKKSMPVESVILEFEITEISTGLIEISLDLNQSLNSAKMFIIRAEYELDDWEDIIYGVQLFTVKE